MYPDNDMIELFWGQDPADVAGESQAAAEEWGRPQPASPAMGFR
jgi:hypothetical protein